MKEFADDNFKFDENGRKFAQMDRKYCWKRRNCSLRATSPFPTVFSRDLNCRHIRTGVVLERVNCPSQINSLSLFILHFYFFLLYSTLPMKLQNVETLSKDEKAL